jgi:hypothetical protein
MSKEEKERWWETCADSAARGKPEISPLAAMPMERDPERKESFCEWAGYFEVRGDNIQQVDENKYNFIKTLYSSLREH